MVCRTSVRTRKPNGEEEELPLSEAIQDAEAEEDPENWEAVSGTTTTVEVDGVEIDRLTSATFEKPSGKRITLNNLDQLYS
jgi:hypothetical protein